MDREETIEASDLSQVVLHLRYMRSDLRQIKERQGEMATRTEVEQLRSEMNGKLDALKKELDTQSTGSVFDRGLSLFTRVGAAVAVLLALWALLAKVVHFVDLVPVK